MDCVLPFVGSIWAILKRSRKLIADILNSFPRIQIMCLPSFSSIFFPCSWPRFLYVIQWVSVTLCLPLVPSSAPPLPCSGLTACHQDTSTASRIFFPNPNSTPILRGPASNLNFLKQSLRSWHSLLWDVSLLFQPGFPLQRQYSGETALCFSLYPQGHFLPLCFCTCHAPSHVYILWWTSPHRPSQPDGLFFSEIPTFLSLSLKSINEKNEGTK